MIRTDLHVHPSPWKHGQGAFRRFAQAAIARGVDILGFSEHGPPCHPDDRYRGLELSQIDDYVYEVEKVKTEYQGFIQIFCGLELDYEPSLLEQYRKLREELPIDYFFGSVHIIDDWHIDTPGSVDNSIHRGKSPQELYRLYYNRVIEVTQCGLFHGLAHIDYIRRSLPHPPRNPPPFSLELFDEIAQEISRSGLTVEINTRGIRIEEMREIHPTKPLLTRLVRAGVRFTIGSDAHEENRIGDGMIEAKNILREMGRDSVFYFNDGIPMEVMIL